METVAALKCRNVMLRPFEEEDLDLLFVWRNDLGSLALWCPRRYPIGRDEFKREFEALEVRNTHIRMMVVHGGKTVGTVHTYDYEALHGWAYICLFLESDVRANGIGPIAWGLFADYLFTNLPLRKLYAEVFGFNSLSRRTLEKAGLELQAQIPEYYYWGGEYHDKYLFALTRERLSIVKEFLAKRR